MPDFAQSGLGDWYGELLNSARQQLVRQSDGTLAPAPQYGAPTSLDAIYGGILPAVPAPPPLVSRSVSTVPIDANGNPIGFSADTMAATRSEQSGSRPAYTQGTQPAGTVTMPPGARPASVERAFAQMQLPQVPLPGMFGRGLRNTVADPFGTRVANQDQSRLPANDGGESGFMAAFYPDATPSAVSAIDSAAPPMPRVRPIPPAQIPLTAFTGGPPTIPGAITFKRGDTVSALAKQLGMTTSSFADRYGITNPNRIRAGDTVVPQAPVMPRMLPAGLNRTPPQVPMPRPRPMRTPASRGETFDSVWAEARG